MKHTALVIGTALSAVAPVLAGCATGSARTGPSELEPVAALVQYFIREFPGMWDGVKATRFCVALPTGSKLAELQQAIPAHGDALVEASQCELQLQDDSDITRMIHKPSGEPAVQYRLSQLSWAGNSKASIDASWLAAFHVSARYRCELTKMGRKWVVSTCRQTGDFRQVG